MGVEVGGFIGGECELVGSEGSEVGCVWGGS